MATKTATIGTKLKETIRKETPAERQNLLTDRVKNYLQTCTDYRRIECSALVWNLLGENSHLAEDEIREMRSSFTDLLVFLTDPVIAEKFKAVRSFYSDRFGDHLRRMLAFLREAENQYAFAEMALYELQLFQLEENALDKMEDDFDRISAL